MASRPHQSFYRELGELIRQHRERHEERLTQEELGRRVGLSRTSIVNIEKGRQHPAVHQLYVFAKELKVTPQALLPSWSDDDSWVAQKLPADTDRKIAQWAKKLA